ncbi:hypothetical protein Ancab_028013 [Ancistrocladus abbreviatus]
MNYTASTMKLDTRGLESTASFFRDTCVLPDAFQTAPSFEIPNTTDFDGFQKEAIQMVKPAKGTTTLAFIFKEGVMVAADSRASMGGYISSQSVKKIIEINPYMLGTMAGGAADCQFWHRNLGIKCRLHELANKRRISVTGASKLLANILYSYRGMGLSVGTMIAGWDETGPGLYYVDSEGGRLKGTRFSVGSGSPYAYGVLDNGYRYEMTVEEAAELARRAIYHATFRDGASGGVASVYYVGPEGWKKLSGDDVGELHYKYYPVTPTVAEQEMAELFIKQMLLAVLSCQWWLPVSDLESWSTALVQGRYGGRRNSVGSGSIAARIGSHWLQIVGEHAQQDATCQRGQGSARGLVGRAAAAATAFLQALLAIMMPVLAMPASLPAVTSASALNFKVIQDSPP